MPQIKRVQVEDGFLDDLDLQLAEGLNVVIGARGTGKTSLLELIRFGLGATGFTEQALAKSDAQVRAILGRGRVRLTISDDDGREVVVTRSVGEEPSDIIRATVLAQSEIEAVGASTHGRLHLVDRFLGPSIHSRITHLRTRSVAVGQQVDAAAQELAALRDQLSDVEPLGEQLAGLQARQSEAFARSSASDSDRAKLETLQSQLQMSALRERLLDQAMDRVGAARRQLAGVSTEPLPPWSAQAGEDPVAEAREGYADALRSVAATCVALEEVEARLTIGLQIELGEQRALEDQARDLRRALGAVDAELAQLSGEIAGLHERLGSLAALQELVDEKEARHGALVDARDELLKELEDARDARFASRRAVVDELNTALAPTIQLELEQSGTIDDYINQIVNRLRGSGLHSRTLAPELARALAPFDLLRLVEADAAAEVASLVGLTTGRVAAAFQHLRANDLSGIAAAEVEDVVELYLLDATTLKRSDDLSIGQRCTAVLPVLLQRRGDVLVIDQPEDHLDNAFVTSTLVESLRTRAPGDQVILASHNANVPVLGEADLVVHLSSDGRRGFVVHAGALDELPTVQAITDVMEGGAAAFRRRAEFYEQHGPR